MHDYRSHSDRLHENDVDQEMANRFLVFKQAAA